MVERKRVAPVCSCALALALLACSTGDDAAPRGQRADAGPTAVERDAAAFGGGSAERHGQAERGALAGADASAADGTAGPVAREHDAAEPDDQGPWVTTWGTTLVDVRPYFPRVFDGVTLRQIVHTSIAGVRLRVRFSNAFGSAPLHIGSAHLALRASGAAIVAASGRRLTFSGAKSTTLAPGEERMSDPIPFDLPALSDVAVSVDLPDATVAATVHGNAIQNSYVSETPGLAGASELAADETLTWWAFLEAIDVEPPVESSAIVAFGDSITDGMLGTVDANRRWPDELARRLAAAGLARGIVNEGYSGNQVLAGGGDSALARFDRDVFANAGVTHAIVLAGINDIGASGATADALIAGYRQLIAQARDAGLKILFGTLCPFEPTFYYSQQGEATRQAVNEWIRGSGEFDGVIDFDQILRDPNAPARLLPAYDSGDALHPSDAGYAAMGDAVDLALLH